MLVDIVQIFLGAGFWAALIRIACPLLVATLGELLCERAGVLNLGIEGIMTVGAMVGWMWVYQGGSLYGGLVFVVLIGACFGAMHGVLTVVLGLSQHVIGIGITLLATSLSYFSYKMLLWDVATPPKIDAFAPLDLGLLSDLPFFGAAFFSHSVLTYLFLLLPFLLLYFLNRTPAGLALRVAGDNPMTLEAQGINVVTVRLLAVIAGSALMALGGAYLTMSAFNAFYFGMINGRGWIAIALVVFASWRPGKALFGALLFAGFDALQVRVQQLPGDLIPYQFYLMTPYLLSIAAMIIIARKADYPRALLVPFRRGERH